MLRRLLDNHFLANTALLLMLVVGVLSYRQLPRELEPRAPFTAVEIVTRLADAPAAEIEARITAPIERAVRGVADVRYVASSSRAQVSRVLVRLRERDRAVIESRIDELRWAVQGVRERLPAGVEGPRLDEVADAGRRPAAEFLLYGGGDPARLRAEALVLVRELGGIGGVGRVTLTGARAPELELRFDADALATAGLAPSALADGVAAHLARSGGSGVQLGSQTVPVDGVAEVADAAALAALPLPAARKRGLHLGEVAALGRGLEETGQRVAVGDAAAVLVAVYRKPEVGAIELGDRLTAFQAAFSARRGEGGVRLEWLDDRTRGSRAALETLERTALPAALALVAVLGLVFGTRFALLAGVGVAGVVATAFWLFGFTTHTLNVGVLLALLAGVGVLVGAVVTLLDALYRRLRRDVTALDAALGAVGETAAPLVAAALTLFVTLLPLVLSRTQGVPGSGTASVLALVLGALLAFVLWLLPGHAVVTRLGLERRRPAQARREHAVFALMQAGARLVIATLRRPALPLLLLAVLLVGAVGALAGGLVRVAPLAPADARSFAIDFELAASAHLEQTEAAARAIEDVVRAALPAAELATTVSYAGLRYTDREAVQAEHIGQVVVTLQPYARGRWLLGDAMAALAGRLDAVPGVVETALVRYDEGRPAPRPISLILRGDDPREVRRAADAVIDILRTQPAVYDIGDDDSGVLTERVLRLKPDAVRAAGLSGGQLLRELRLLGGGAVVAYARDGGEPLAVRVTGQKAGDDVDAFLARRLALPDGRSVALGELVEAETRPAVRSIRRYDLRHAITVEAEIDRSRTNAYSANQVVTRWWEADFAARFPGVQLARGGPVAELQQGLQALTALFVLGAGLGYLILATHFGSYRQPFVVLAAVPVALIALVAGLVITRQSLGAHTAPLGLALLGLTLHAFIAQVTLGNARVHGRGDIARAAVAAARQRLVPTLAGALALATGFGVLAAAGFGATAVWTEFAAPFAVAAPLAALLTLYVVPALYAALTTVADEAGSGTRLAAWWRRRVAPSAPPPDPLAALTEAEPALRPLLERARAARAARDHVGAVRALDEAARRAPQSAELHLQLVEELLRYQRATEWELGMHQRAERHLAQATRLEPQHPRLAALTRAVADAQRGATGAVAGALAGAAAIAWQGPLRLPPLPGREAAPARRAARRVARSQRAPVGAYDVVIALRNLVRHRKRSAAALTAIAFGAVALILAGGFIEWILWATREAAIQGQLGHIQVVRHDYLIKGTADPYGFLQDGTPPKALGGLPHVKVIAPRLAFSGLVSYGDITVPYIAQGVDPEREAAISVDYRIVAGRGLGAADAAEVIIGTGLADTLGIRPGDTLVLTGTTQDGGFNAVELAVAGLFSTATKAINDIALRMPLKYAQELLRVEGVHTWVVLLDDTDTTDAVLAQLRQGLERGGGDLQAVPWYALSDFYNKSAELFSRQINVVRLMIAVIIVLSISNSLMMNVMERTGEIGTLRALGARARSILRLFSLEALVLGLAGALAGCTLGILAAAVLSTVGIPMPPPPGMDKGFVAEILVTPELAWTTFALAVVATTLSGLYPAWKASRLVIVDALRHNR